MGLLSNISVGIAMLIFGLFGPPMHEFHFSNCEIEHNANTHAIEITLKLFTDDFEAAIAAKGGNPVDIMTQSEDSLVNLHVKNYLLEHFEVDINGETITPIYLGIEPDIQTTRCYLEIPNTYKIQSIRLQNQVLMDQFSEQRNIVYILIAKKKYSLIFEIDSDTQELSL